MLPVEVLIYLETLTVQYLIGENWKNSSRKSWVNRLNLSRKLNSLRLKDGESVQEHVKMMVETFSELSIVGDTITDKDRVVYLLASLPEFSTHWLLLWNQTLLFQQ